MTGHYVILRRVGGGWQPACGCGWTGPRVVQRERTARRVAWDHIGAAEDEAAS